MWLCAFWLCLSGADLEVALVFTKRRYFEALWLLAAEDVVLWKYRCPHMTKAGFSFAMVLVDNTRCWYEKVDNDKGGIMFGAKLAACLGSSVDYTAQRHA